MKSIDEISMGILIRRIESWAQGKPNVESVPNMLRHLERCLPPLSGGPI